MNSSYDFGGSRVSTGSSQFGGITNIGNSSGWQPQTPIDSIGKSFGSHSFKFNPLQGTGNSELLAFLDNLQSTLRSSGFNDQSVSEVMQAMQVLAKYNIMGLGLGLGVAAMAQMRNTENAIAQQNVLLTAQNSSSVQQQRYEVMPQSNMLSGGSLMDSQPSIDQDMFSETRMIRVGWAAWIPCPQGQISLADTVTLQVVGGPRSSPSDGLCLRDISQTSLIRHSLNLPPGLPIQWPLSRSKIDIRFNFVSVLESDQMDLSAMSSQQTPLPRPDVRPQSSIIEQFERPSSQKQVECRNSTPTIEYEEEAVYDDKGADLLSPVRSDIFAPRHHQLPVSVQENQQNVIEVELPSARVSAFPRRVIMHLSRFSISLIAGPDYKSIDPMTKRDIHLELEKMDKFAVNEVSIQFMAFKKMNFFGSHSSSLFFTFQFFRFDPITTESLFMDVENGMEELFVLWRNGADNKNDAPGLTIRFAVGAGQRADFTDYLLRESVQLHVWESDSLFYVGTASIPLRCLLRQNSAAILSSIQAPVVLAGFLPGLGINQLTGVLYLRIANSGRKVQSIAKSPVRQHLISHGEKAQSLNSANGMNPLERFLKFQRLDLEQRSMRIFGKDEDERMRQWAQLRGQHSVAVPGPIAAASTKFLFSEELAAYRAIRREGKALTLLKAVFSSVTTRLRMHAIGGQVLHIRFQLRNPFPEDCICAMEVNDSRLSPVTSKDELKYLGNKISPLHKNGLASDVFHREGDSWMMVLRGMEKVEIALRFDTKTTERDWIGNMTEARAFFRRLPSGDPLAILEANISISRPYLSQHFRWFIDEGRKLIRTVPINEQQSSLRVLSIRTSDPSVLCRIQLRPSDGIQQIHIECPAGEMAEVRDFIIFLYADLYNSHILAVHRFSIHSMGRQWSETIQGAEARVHLTLPSSGRLPPPEGELIRLFCSSPPSASNLHFLPSPTFASSIQSLAQISLHFRPSTLGNIHLLINAVASSTSTLIGHWMVSVAVNQPNIVKVFEVTIPRGIDGSIQKRILLDNPLSIPRHFRLSSSDERILSLPTSSPPPIPAHSSIPLQMNLHPPMNRPTTIQALLFAEDTQTGNQEESYAVKIRFE